jgi:hypothetical protein
MLLPAVLYRCLPSLVAAVLYAVFILLWRTNHAAFAALETAFAFMGDGAPYSDLNAILQAAACAHQGVNVYVPSPCMGGGVYNYSPFFLHLWSGIGSALRFPLGLSFGAMFLLAATLLPPAQGRWQLALRAAALCSGCVIWGLETANLDGLLFALCVAGLALVLAGRVQGFAGYALFALGGALKFYPAILLALALRERRARFAAIAVVLALGGAVFLWCYGAGTLTALAMLPAGLPFRGVFGAVNWPFGLALLRFLPVLTLEPNVPQYFWALQQPHMLAYVVITSRLLTIAGLYTAWRLAPAYAVPVAALPEAEKLFLAAGCMVIAFCFFAAQNLDYRGIYLLLILPALQYWARSGTSRWLLAAVLLLMWEGTFRHAFAMLGPRGIYLQVGFWLLREYIWWFIVVRLTAIALIYVRTSLQTLLADNRMRLRRVVHDGGEAAR